MIDVLPLLQRSLDYVAETHRHSERPHDGRLDCVHCSLASSLKQAIFVLGMMKGENTDVAVSELAERTARD